MHVVGHGYDVRIGLEGYGYACLYKFLGISRSHTPLISLLILLHAAACIGKHVAALIFSGGIHLNSSLVSAVYTAARITGKTD